jgi:hypothetical protein
MRFRKLDVTKPEQRQMLIDTFINAIYLYDDKVVITFNYKDGTKEITRYNVADALESQAQGSDMDCSGAPKSAVESQDSAAFFVFASMTHKRRDKTAQTFSFFANTLPLSFVLRV